MKITLLNVLQWLQRVWHLLVGALLCTVIGIVIGLYLFAKYYDTPEIQLTIDKIKTKGKGSTEIVIPVQQPVQDSTKHKRILFWKKK